MSNYRINTVRTMLADVSSVLDGERSENRFALADVCEMICAADSFFPRKPHSITRKAAGRLRKKVDSGCPLCVHPDTMAKHIEATKNLLYVYRPKLVKWLETEGEKFDSDGNIIVVPVSELRPNFEK